MQSKFHISAAWGAVLFVLFLLFFEEVVFDAPQLSVISRLASTDAATLAVWLVSSLLVMGLFVALIWLALCLPRPWRLMAWLAFFPAAVVQYGYWKAVHRFFSSLDVGIALSSPPALWGTAWEMYFHPISLIPVGALGWVLWTAPSSAKRVGLRLLIAVVLMWGMLFGLEKTPYPVNPGPSVFQFYVTWIWQATGGTRPLYRQALNYQAAAPPHNNLVLVIDESIRPDHLSLNGYARQTTPYLDQLVQSAGDNWGMAVAGGTCSPISNALLLTGIPPAPGAQDQAAVAPTIFHYAKAMGYHTVYIDAQTNTLWNGLNLADLNVVDEWITVDDLGSDIETDFRAAEQIHTRITTSNGQFIVLNKRGVHFFYEESYPPEAAVWLPTDRAYLKNPELVINAYDNGVHYNVDGFFSRLLPDPEQDLQHTTVIYTSDHGQTLFEHRETWTHCNSSKNEAETPLIVIGTPTAMSPTPGAAHWHIFPTLLDLMNVPGTTRVQEYAPSLLTVPFPIPDQRQFFSGSLEVVQYE